MKEKPKFDPKLKKAMSEIAAVCQRHDIGGHISLVSKTHGEFRFMIPTWSKWREEVPGTGHYRLKHAKTDPVEELELTCHLLFSMRDTVVRASSFLIAVCEYIETKSDVDHVPWSGFIPHDPVKHDPN